MITTRSAIGGAAARRPRKLGRRLLLTVAVCAAIAAPAAADPPTDPFPLGGCVRSTMIDPRPICVMVDPLP